MSDILIAVVVSILLIVLFAALVWGLVELVGWLESDPGTTGSYQQTNVEWIKIADYVFRIVDYDAQVVCYAAYDDAIDCLPLNQTALPRE